VAISIHHTATSFNRPQYIYTRCIVVVRYHIRISDSDIACPEAKKFSEERVRFVFACYTQYLLKSVQNLPSEITCDRRQSTTDYVLSRSCHHQHQHRQVTYARILTRAGLFICVRDQVAATIFCRNKQLSQQMSKYL